MMSVHVKPRGQAVDVQDDCLTMVSSTPDKLLLTVPEVCRILSIGRSLAYELIGRGVIPSVRLGERRVLVPVSALQERLTQLVNQKSI